MAPACTEAKVGQTITMAAKTFAMDASYNYTAEGINGDVYCGTSFDDLADTGIKAAEGYFDITFTAPGDYVVVVKSSVGDAAGFVKVEKASVQVSNQDLTVDGKKVDIDHYNINDNNFFKLRDLACVLNGTSNTFDVGYDKETRTIALTTGQAYTPIEGDMVIGADNSASAVVSNQKITVNGEAVGLTAVNIGGSNYFKLRDLEKYLGYAVGYDTATRTSQITTK